MGFDSKIAWTHHTFNCWWGCVRVSEACRYCYAETWAKRTGHDVWGPSGSRRFFSEKHWNGPVNWNNKAEKAGERYRVFCASMCDVFEKLPDDHPDAEEMEKARVKLWKLIEKTKNLDWLLLTKRPENIMKMIPAEWQDKLPDNVWAGTTAEDQETADERCEYLAKVPAKIRFLSCEPLLGPIKLTNDKINWIIVGGESGGSARDMLVEWVKDIQSQCKESSTPFFMKQMGTVWAKNNGLVWPNKADSLDSLPQELQVREFPSI